MTIQVDFWYLVGLLLGFISTMGTFGFILLKQIDRRIDADNERLSVLEKDLAETKIKLPLEYQRREDAMRFETLLNAKLDAMYSRIERLVERTYEI